MSLLPVKSPNCGSVIMGQLAYRPAYPSRLPTMTDHLDQSHIRRYRRIVVKAGTALITGGTRRLDLETMASLVGQIARMHTDGCQMLLVSSGAVAAGSHVLDVSEAGRDLPARQVLAAIGQGRLINAYEQLFGWHDVRVAQALLTGKDLGEREGYSKHPQHPVRTDRSPRRPDHQRE